MKNVLLLYMLVLTANALPAQEIFCRFQYQNRTFYGQVMEHVVFKLDKAPWEGGRKTKTPPVSLKDIKLLAPSEPRLILGLGKSYKESWEGKKPFANVRWFLKPPSSAAAPGDVVTIPVSVDALKVEVELVIVIGKHTKNATESEAAASIFGYTMGNDIVGYTDSYYRKEGDSARGEDPLLGSGLKIGDGFAPFGPFIYTHFDWQNRLRTLVVTDPSGRQKVSYKNSTAHLLYPPAKIVSDLSKVLTLSPGDIIFSGTSNSFVVTHGDCATIAIEGIGEMKNTFKAEQTN
jgi:2-keto-4-pentenoate hydratase/2-oxohepta-3-ene-1,7-dioic acid hydratase in catechol pathway